MLELLSLAGYLHKPSCRPAAVKCIYGGIFGEAEQ